MPDERARPPRLAAQMLGLVDPDTEGPYCECIVVDFGRPCDVCRAAGFTTNMDAEAASNGTLPYVYRVLRGMEHEWRS